jgi:hypothetical protein
MASHLVVVVKALTTVVVRLVDLVVGVVPLMVQLGLVALVIPLQPYHPREIMVEAPELQTRSRTAAAAVRVKQVRMGRALSPAKVVTV